MRAEELFGARGTQESRPPSQESWDNSHPALEPSLARASGATGLLVLRPPEL